jgi:hypothetical protein
MCSTLCYFGNFRISSTWKFDNLSFRQHAYMFDKMSFRQHICSTKCRFGIIYVRQNVVSATYMFDNMSVRQLGFLVQHNSTIPISENLNLTSNHKTILPWCWPTTKCWEILYPDMYEIFYLDSACKQICIPSMKFYSQIGVWLLKTKW